MTGFLAKYWKKIGLAVLGLFLVISPLFFMFYAGVLIGHFVTSRFSYKLDVKVVKPKAQRFKKGEDLQEEDLDPEPVVKTAAKALPAFETAEEKKEENA